MTNALEVATEFIRLASWEDEPEYLSHLRLQKLLYYAQGWSLASRKEPLFPDRVEAWAHGPVVPRVYDVFSIYGHRPIPPEDFESQIRLDEADASFIASVWDAYKGYSAGSLRAMTHEEAPWVEARKGYGPADRCDVEITQKAMADYFSSQA